jgi:hypothetical protein
MMGASPVFALAARKGTARASDVGSHRDAASSGLRGSEPHEFLYVSSAHLRRLAPILPKVSVRLVGRRAGFGGVQLPGEAP